MGFPLVSMGQDNGVSILELKPAFQQQKPYINVYISLMALDLCTALVYQIKMHSAFLWSP